MTVEVSGTAGSLSQGPLDNRSPSRRGWVSTCSNAVDFLYIQLWVIDANWHHIHNVCYGRLTPIGVNATFLAFFVHSTSVQCPMFGLWLAADHRYLVVALGCAGSNQVGVTKDLQPCWVDSNGD